jgi:hypothetical protein
MAVNFSDFMGITNMGMNFENGHLTCVLPLKLRRRLEAALKNPYKSEKNPYVFLCFLMFSRRFLIDRYR